MSEALRAAQANLKKIVSGQMRREREEGQRIAAERKQRDKQWRAEEAAERKAKREQLKKWKKELKELQKEWGWLYELDDLSGTKADLGVADHVVLEEVDSWIVRLQEKIAAAEWDAWQQRRGW